MKPVFVLLLSSLVSLTAMAIDTGAAFEDPEMQAKSNDQGFERFPRRRFAPRDSAHDDRRNERCRDR
jgi:hypothetical protein